MAQLPAAANILLLTSLMTRGLAKDINLRLNIAQVPRAPGAEEDGDVGTDYSGVLPMPWAEARGGGSASRTVSRKADD